MSVRLTGYGALSALLALPALFLTSPSDPAAEAAPPASSRFAWGDYDGDGLDDAYVILATGQGGLLHNEGDGTLRDVTTEAGLDGVAFPSFASWRDVDADGTLDLLVGTRAGDRLFRNFGAESFEDVTASAGLELLAEETVEAAHWLDYDADGRPDLHVLTRAGDLLFHGAGDGRFERAELPVAAVGDPTTTVATTAPGAGAEVDARPGAETDTHTDDERGGESGGEFGRGPGRATRTSGTRGTLAQATGGPGAVVTNPGGVQYVGSLPQNYACPDAIVDQADGVTCMQASSVPTLGLLYPISEDLFVATTGEVGVGTTSPAGARLHAVGRDAANPPIEDGESALRADGGLGYYGGAGASVTGGTGLYSGGDGIVATGGVAPTGYAGVGARIAGGTGSEYGGAGATVAGGAGQSSGGDGIVATGGATPTGSAGVGARITGGAGSTGGAGAEISAGSSSGSIGGIGASIVGGGAPGYDGTGGIGATIAGGSASGTYSTGGAGARITGGAGTGYMGGGGAGAEMTGGDGGNYASGGAGAVVRGGDGGYSGAPGLDAEGGVSQFGIEGLAILARGRVSAESLASGSIDVSGPLDVDGGTLHVDDANNRVGVGTTTPSRRLHVKNGASGTNPTTNSSLVVEADSEASISLISPPGAEASIFFGNSVSGANAGAFLFNPFGGELVNGLVLRTDDTNRLAITEQGNVGIGTSFPAQRLSVNGSAGKPGGGSWSTFSDARLKQNITDLEGALDTLLALRGVTFEYEDPEAIGELAGTRIGFVAQEVEEVLPDWVEEGADGYKQLTVRGFEALAVEALREQQATIERQAEELREERALGAERQAEAVRLREELDALRERVAGLESIEDEIAALKAALADR